MRSGTRAEHAMISASTIPLRGIPPRIGSVGGGSVDSTSSDCRAYMRSIRYNQKQPHTSNGGKAKEEERPRAPRPC